MIGKKTRIGVSIGVRELPRETSVALGGAPRDNGPEAPSKAQKPKMRGETEESAGPVDRMIAMRQAGEVKMLKVKIKKIRDSGF
jgi:hypothetical protein